MAASVALAGAGACAREPPEKIVPYADGPELAGADKPLFFATASSLDGYGSGVLVESHMGRPTKVEGNPLHPASLGSTDIFAQASVLTLWDPERSKAVLHAGSISTWDAFEGALADLRPRFDSNGGAGLRVLTGAVSSPTLVRQLRALLRKYPRAHWHQYQPVNRDNVYAGTQLAFGARLEPRYDFTRARCVCTLDADFLTALPGHVRYARDFIRGRRTDASTASSSRLYAIESTPTVTGAIADHRIAMRASDVDAAARALARRLGVEVDRDSGLEVREDWLDALAADLQTHRGASLVVAGEGQSPAVHALAYAINARLGNIGATVKYTEPVLTGAVDQSRSLQELTAAMNARQVDALIILGGNPAYATPADLRFSDALARVAWSAHLGLYRDETARRCTWHVPMAHELETWSDVRAHDGTVTVQQPLIAPLYSGRSAHEVLASLVGEIERDGYEIVRRTWREQSDAGDFETAWKRVLHRGMIDDSAFPARDVSLVSPFRLPGTPGGAKVSGGRSSTQSAAHELELIIRADPTIHDGRYANNAWLQELPKPITELTWDNAALVSAATARRLNVIHEELVELQWRDRTIRAPIWILPGHPDDSITIHLGYGRTHAGNVGDGAGFNAYALQTSDAPHFGVGLVVRGTGAQYVLATTQLHHRMHGRDLARRMHVQHFAGPASAAEQPRESRRDLLYPPFPSPDHAWGMSINLDACIGCKACTIACQAENNIPVVGKTEVLRGREMHWIRVDHYFEGPAASPRSAFQPVPCMQCERAPCEVVCPVEASVHNSEGLNVQVYNRCVGTRFCSNNCPYKVRRFNFLQYAPDEPTVNAQRNPNVTVRMRGVMEKCTYCIQRIAVAKIEADKENRRIRDGEIVTACQAACPTQAIVFGDINDPFSRVTRAKSSPLDYALLAELHTLPRTTYLPKLDNPNPRLRDG